MVVSVMAGGLAIGLLIVAIVLKSSGSRVRRSGADGSSVAYMGDGGGDSGCDSGSGGGDGGCSDGGGGGGGGD